ncbi:MAG: 5-deoxy-glucuronate isomerase [Actinomycetes bacterium]
MIDLEGATVVLSADDGRLGYAVADRGVQVTTTNAVAWVVVEGGRGFLDAAGQHVRVGTRNDVFGGAGWSAYVGTHATATADSDLRCIVVWRACDGDNPSRIIDPADVQVEERGSGAFARTVRTYLADGPLIAGETINPPGGWSSYPPHRHDDFEEAYLYRFAPAGGFGLAARYDDDGAQESTVVRDGDVTRIPRGYHPVVAAPGYAMAYTWALAGDTQFSPQLDPAHEWVA